MRTPVALAVLLALFLPVAVGCGRRSSEWVAVTAEDGSFRAELPGAPRRIHQSRETPAGPAPIEMWVHEDGERAFMVGYTEYPERVRSLVGEEELLDSARDGAVAGAHGRLLVDEPRELGGVTGRHVEIDSDGGRVRVRGHLYVVGRRLYQVFATVEPVESESAEVQRFLESFRILPRTDADVRVEVK
jgi:hypothetical protein